MNAESARKELLRAFSFLELRRKGAMPFSRLNPFLSLSGGAVVVTFSAVLTPLQYARFYECKKLAASPN